MSGSEATVRVILAKNLQRSRCILKIAVKIGQIIEMTVYGVLPGKQRLQYGTVSEPELKDQQSLVDGIKYTSKSSQFWINISDFGTTDLLILQYEGEYRSLVRLCQHEYSSTGMCAKHVYKPFGEVLQCIDINDRSRVEASALGRTHTQTHTNTHINTFPNKEIILVIGCPHDINLPSGAVVIQQTNSFARIGCKPTYDSKTWTLQCINNEWQDDGKNCTEVQSRMFRRCVFEPNVSCHKTQCSRLMKSRISALCSILC